MNIINPWKEKIYGKDFEIDSRPVFKYKDCAIYKQYDKGYLYVRGDIAFNQLAGLNKQHLMAFADCDKSKTTEFLWDMACENYDKGVVYQRENETLYHEARQ
jgi:hypothetical protein